jgi:hypothetical protein
MQIRAISRVLGLPFFFGIAACTGPSVYVPMPQSNFVPPNSTAANTQQHVKATVSSTYIYPFQNPIIPDARQQREVYAKALQGSDGDLITDGYFAVRSTLIPLFFIQVYNVESTVEGTAVRVVEIGRRPLQ